MTMERSRSLEGAAALGLAGVGVAGAAGFGVTGVAAGGGAALGARSARARWPAVGRAGRERRRQAQRPAGLRAGDAVGSQAVPGLEAADRARRGRAEAAVDPGRAEAVAPAMKRALQALDAQARRGLQADALMERGRGGGVGVGGA